MDLGGRLYWICWRRWPGAHATLDVVRAVDDIDAMIALGLRLNGKFPQRRLVWVKPA